MVRVVAEEHANGVASRVGGQAIRHELDCGACGNGAVGVVEVVGALGDDEERQAERECTEGRAGAAVRHDSGAVREQQLLRDVLVHVDVRRLQTEHRGVVLLADRDDDVQRFVAEAVEQRSEDAEVSVVDGAERDVDDRQAAQRIEPREARLPVAESRPYGCPAPRP